jgi:hypothetical protein
MSSFRGAMVTASPAAAAPGRRPPWVVLKCMFSDVPGTPWDDTFFARNFTAAGAGAGGMYDYWMEQSAGPVEAENAAVFGWFDLPVSLADAKGWKWPFARERLVQMTATIAEPTVDLTGFDVIVVALNAIIDSGSASRRTLQLSTGGRKFGLVNLDPAGWFPSFAAHEIGHGYGLPQSFADQVTVGVRSIRAERLDGDQPLRHHPLLAPGQRMVRLAPDPRREVGVGVHRPGRRISMKGMETTTVDHSAR